VRLTLSDKIAELIQKKFDNGPYSSLEEVIVEALNLLDQRDEKLAALRQDIQEGLASGDGRLFDEAVVEDIKKRGRGLLG
jgi:putative addiction module CopG family antidote